jgi:hypothetical protein
LTSWIFIIFRKREFLDELPLAAIISTMPQRILFQLLFCFLFKCAISQDYFDLFYTNIPKSKYNQYSMSNLYGLGWIQTGNYNFPTACENCFDQSRDSKLTPLFIDSIVGLYDKSIMDTLYRKKYVPSSHYFVFEKSNTKPYITKTLYRIIKGKVEPLVQIKMTFYDRQHQLPGISNIEFLQSDKMRRFDSKLVLEAYRKQLKDDSEEIAPPIEGH